VRISDYSRYLLAAEHFDHTPSGRELANSLEALSNRPEKILIDNGRNLERYGNGGALRTILNRYTHIRITRRIKGK
jgi:hypothetical protein